MAWHVTGKKMTLCRIDSSYDLQQRQVVTGCRWALLLLTFLIQACILYFRAATSSFGFVVQLHSASAFSSALGQYEPFWRLASRVLAV